MTKERSILAILGIIFLIGIATWIVSSREPPAFGSIETGQEYNSTTTTQYTTGTFASWRTLKTGQGSLGSVIVTGANTGWMMLLDATTTNVNLRANRATSTLVIAELPASLAAGTYVFDATFTAGLLLVNAAGVSPTSTVTWR